MEDCVNADEYSSLNDQITDIMTNEMPNRNDHYDYRNEVGWNILVKMNNFYLSTKQPICGMH